MTLGQMDLSHLNDEERHKVLEVLQRDEQLRESEQKRVRNLKDEVKTLRLKGTIREGRSATRTCARCRESFGIFFNTGSICPKCQHRVCKKCQESVSPGKWICIFCFRQMEFEAKSGNWFYSKFPRSMRDRATNEIISGGKIVHDAISSGSFVDGLDAETVSACTASVSPRLLFLSSMGKNSAELETHTCVGTEHALETYHNSSGPTEFVLPREATVLGAAAQFGASERKGDFTTMGTVSWGYAENNNCSADLDSEWVKDSIFPGLPVMRVQCENPVETEQTESGARRKFAELEQVENVGKGKVEVPDEVLPADQSESGMSTRLEDSKSPEHMASKGGEELTGLADFKRSSALTRDEDIEQHARPVSGMNGKECGSLGLYDSNDSVFEDEEDEELCVSNKCEGIVGDSNNGFHVLCCAEAVNNSDNESRDVVVPSGSMSKETPGRPFNGSNETSMPLTVVSDCKDMSLHPASGSRSSPIPLNATDSEDITNSTVFAMDVECSLDSRSKPVSISELTGSLNEGVSADYPVNEYNTVDNLASDSLPNMLATCRKEDIAACHFMNKDISESCSSGEDMSISCGTSLSCPVYKDAMDDSVLILHAAETKAGGSEDISAPLVTDSTNSSYRVALPNLADGKQELPVMLLGVATDLADEDSRIPVTSSLKSDKTDRGCEIPVTPPDVTGVSCSNGSCDINVSPTQTLSCSEQTTVSGALERDSMGSSSSSCDTIVLNNNCSNGSAEHQDSVRSKVGALLAKYGRRVDCEKSPDGRNDLTEGTKSLLLNGSEPYNERTQVSLSVSYPSMLKDTDADFHRYNSERDDDDLWNKRDLAVLVDSSVLVNNINNSNSSNHVFNEDLFDIKDGYDFLGKFNDCKTNSDFQNKEGRITSPSKQSWHQAPLPEEENGMDSYGSSDGFSHEKYNNFLLDDLEWDTGELDGSNGFDDFNTGAGENFEDSTFGLYSTGTSESHSTDLSSLRDMLSTCLSHSSAAAGSPPHSPSELDNAVFFHQPSVVINNGRGFSSRQKFRRMLANRRFSDREVTIASNEDDDDDNDSLLSAISEHTEPDYMSELSD